MVSASELESNWKHRVRQTLCFFWRLNMIKRLWEHRKWKLHLYYNGVKIKTIRIDENEAPAETSYAIRVYFKKFLFHNTISGVVVRPVRLLKNDESKKETHWGCTFETGIEI